MHSHIKDFSQVQEIKFQGNGILFFYDFDLAYLSKLYLLNRLKETYTKELKELKEKMERNVPDVQNELMEMKEKFPEYFI